MKYSYIAGDNNFDVLEVGHQIIVIITITIIIIIIIYYHYSEYISLSHIFQTGLTTALVFKHPNTSQAKL